MDVYITNDVEVWCNGWHDIDGEFPSAFRKYIYGETDKGHYGLPFQLEVLNKYKLKSVFFVEPLFAAHFGEAYLKEVIALIQNAGQEVQLHLHPEWTDEALEPLLPNVTEKRQNLYMYSLNEQRTLIAKGKQMLLDNGCKQVSAFRAGSFAANNDTLLALRDNHILIDSSYNETYRDCHICQERPPVHFSNIEGLAELPMTTYQDYPGHTRHLQLTACSFGEIKRVLLDAERKGWQAVVLLMHSFECLTSDKLLPDTLVIDRFEKLCQFLANNRERFTTKGFNATRMDYHIQPKEPLVSNLFEFSMRIAQQAYRRLKY
ncbi:hypothetical protein GCM10009092_37420 [Bowmanella denitrificans]|uniref:Polysaccharide deacetylase n=1 Tax=Bowmanella denitrificans TaxID=366582 RepID=A0ABP3HGR7_9ALTE